MISNKLTETLKRDFPLRQTTFLTEKPARNPIIALERKSERQLEYGRKLKRWERKYKGRYMVIATAIGYYRAKKEHPEELAKALGFAFAIMPNILRNGSKVGMGIENGVFVSKRKVWGDNDDLMIEKGKEARYVRIGPWDLGIEGNEAFSPKMRPQNGKIVKWSARDFDNQMAKLSQKQQKKMFNFLEKEWQELKLTPKLFDRKCWGQGWQTFIQVMLEKIGDLIY